MNYNNGYSDHGYQQPYADQGTTYHVPNSEQSYYGGPQYTQHQDTTFQQGHQSWDAFHMPNGGQQTGWGANFNSVTDSQQHGFGTLHQSGYNPPFNAQSAPAQCTCGCHTGYHETYCPQYYNSQGNPSSPAHYGYNTGNMQASIDYNQQANTSAYNPCNAPRPDYLSPNYGPMPSDPIIPAPVPLPLPAAAPSSLAAPAQATSSQVSPAQATPPQPASPQKPSHGNPHHKSSLVAAWSGAVAGIGGLGTGIAQLFKNSD